MFRTNASCFFTKAKTISERWPEDTEDTTTSFAFPSNDEVKAELNPTQNGVCNWKR